MGHPFEDHDDALLEPTTGAGSVAGQADSAVWATPHPEKPGPLPNAEGTAQTKPTEAPVGQPTAFPQPITSTDSDAPITSAQLDQLTAKAESLNFSLKTVSAESRKRGFNKLSELTQSQWKELMNWLETEGK